MSQQFNLLFMQKKQFPIRKGVEVGGNNINMEQIKKIQQIVIKNSTYAVVDMQQDYPFATVQQATEQIVLVRKNLTFQNQNQLKIIEKMSDILYSLDHQNLVAFVHAEQSSPNTCSFLYQYAPLTIDRWLLDVGEDMVEQLEFQLTSLAGYLTSNGVKFNFDPKCVGLSKDIKIKYFLKEFSIDNQNKLANYKDNQTKIANFFQQLKLSQQQSQQKQQNKFQRGSFESNRKVDSFQTRESLGMRSCRSDGSTKGNQGQSNLTARLQDTKKRSLQLLARMKSRKDKMV